MISEHNYSSLITAKHSNYAYINSLKVEGLSMAWFTATGKQKYGGEGGENL